MRVVCVTGLHGVAAESWNRLRGAENPFLRYEFLSAFEHTGCVGGDSGWQPCHILLYDEAALLGAVPLYVKYHSYGEYVFDWAWADAYRRYGHAYYPKLVAAVPFTPVTGARLLFAPEADTEVVATRLTDAVRAHADDLGCSSVHGLFPNDAQTEWFAARGWLKRTGYQFHWHNRGYRDFDHYLADFTADRRKKIRQERRYVREAGVCVHAVSGEQATPAQWDALYRYYLLTLRRHGATAYLNREFFKAIAATLPERALLVLAYRGADCVGASLNLRGIDALYGRYWGGEAGINALHFEVCYYTPIEYSIAHGLARFEAGAQGEHKLARGLVPTRTYSVHWLRHPEFQHAVADFLAREGRGVERYLTELNDHAPFRTAIDEVR